MQWGYIKDLEEVEEVKAKREFESRVKQLNDSIDCAIKKEEAPSFKRAFQKIREMPDSNQKELDEKLWHWNDGNLRTPVEVNNKEWREEYWEVDTCGDRYTLFKFLGFIPCIIDFCIFVYSINHYTGDALCTTFFMFLPLLCLGFFIASAIDSLKMSEARKHGVEPFDKKYQDTRRSRDTNAAIGIAGTISGVKSTKNSIKKVTDVDNWPKT